MECLDSYTYKYYEHKWVFEFLHRFVISDSYTKFYTMCINELSNFYTDQYIMHTRELDCILSCLCYQIARPVDRNDLCSRWRSGQINSMQHQNNNFFKILKIVNWKRKKVVWRVTGSQLFQTPAIMKIILCFYIMLLICFFVTTENSF